MTLMPNASTVIECVLANNDLTVILRYQANSEPANMKNAKDVSAVPTW